MSHSNSGLKSASPRGHFVVFFCCLALGFVFTLPGSLHPGRALLGYPGDNFQHAWFLWHFARAVATGQNPFYTNLIFYPNQVNLAWSTTDPLAGTLALPLSVTTGPILTYNLSLILQLALGAFFARLLCLRICRNEVAAFVGGIVFGFSPFLLAHALGHLSLVTAFPIPLYVLALARILDTGNPSWKDGVLLGFALLLTALAHYNYTVFCLMLTLVILAVDLVLDGAGRLKKIWLPLGAGAVTFLLGFLPLLRMLLGNASDVPSPRSFENIQKYSADVVGFLIPSWNHLLFGRFAQHLDLKIFTAGYEGTVYIGPVILILAFVGFARGMAIQPRWTLRASVTAFCFYLLSLGPRLRFFGRQSRIPGPALLLYESRFSRFLSSPARFDVLVMLGASILCAIGCAWLLDSRTAWPKNKLIPAAVVAFLLSDLLTVPFPNAASFDAVRYPDSAAIMRPCALPAAAQSGTVLTLPLQEWPYNVKAMAMQMADEGRYPLLDGYVSYSTDPLWSQFQRFAALRSLAVPPRERKSLQHFVGGQNIAPRYTSPSMPLEAMRSQTLAGRQPGSEILRYPNLSAVVVFDSAQHQVEIQYLKDTFHREPISAGSCSIFETKRVEPGSIKRSSAGQ